MIIQLWHLHLKTSEDFPLLTLVMSGDMCWTSTKVLSIGFAHVISWSPKNHFSGDREQHLCVVQAADMPLCPHLSASVGLC